MTDDIATLEQDIERSRARLDIAIDKLQDKMTVSGVLDDALGAVRRGPYASVYDTVVDTVRRNPVPVLLVAAGIGMFLMRMGQPRRTRSVVIVTEPPIADVETEILIVEDEIATMVPPRADPFHR